MTKGNTQERDDHLFGNDSTILAFGIISLGSYWAWIFATFSSVALNPFGDEGIVRYCLLLVIFAGTSALTTLAVSLVPERTEAFFKGRRGFVLLTLTSCLNGIPALAAAFGVAMTFPAVALLWAVSGLASSLVLMKTIRFLVWLKRAKISRCISLSFLVAAALYAVPQLLAPALMVAGVMVLPALACIFTYAAGRRMDASGDASTQSAQGGAEPRTHADSLKARFSELRNFIPLTLIYTVSFGVVSYAVLYLACVDHMIFVIVLSILFSAAFLAACTFFLKMRIDADKFRRVLLMLAAVAMLPFPYVDTTLRVVFLSFAVFGFTCFDAIGWGDLADEVRDRRLGLFRYTSTATFVNFLGIFLGWAIGYALFALLGPEHFDTGFGVVSVVLVMMIILYMTITGGGEESESGVAKSTQFQDAWKDKCHDISEQHKLTKQEERIFMMLARGRSYGYIADELYISTHTVKTHIYHIYRKVDIHSQQELIDLVEEDFQ